jgi:hypothetical protein
VPGFVVEGREGSRRRRAPTIAPVPLAIRRRFEERFTARRMTLNILTAT